MSAADGSLKSPIVPLITPGPPDTQWNLVITCDGFTQNQLANGDFATHALNFANYFLTVAPFKAMAAQINIYRLDTSSTQDGADDPSYCGGTGAVRNTFFDASFCADGQRRGVSVDYDRVVAAVSTEFPIFQPEFDAIVVFVNSTLYGGRADRGVAVATVGNTSHDIALHEIGHLCGLGEEYEGANTCHGPIEPPYPNLTVAKTLNALKPAWKNLVLPSTPIPSSTNRYCKNSHATPVLQGTPIGTFEGGRATNCCVYRPALTCRMRDISQPFCAVCQAQIVRRLTLKTA